MKQAALNGPGTIKHGVGKLDGRKWHLLTVSPVLGLSGVVQIIPTWKR